MYCIQISKLESQWFSRSGTFKVPDNIHSLFVIAVGGGGGGSSGYQSGGAGGYVKCGNVKVNQAELIRVTIGFGGRGAQRNELGTNDIDGCTSGGMSSFGNLLFANGGNGCKNWRANSGGTGSGAACSSLLSSHSTVCISGGTGGSNGSNGGSASDGQPGGDGQGDEYSKCLLKATNKKLSAGAGGSPGNRYCKGENCRMAFVAGGGGGVFVNGEGPSAADGIFQFLKNFLTTRNTTFFAYFSSVLLK